MRSNAHKMSGDQIQPNLRYVPYLRSVKIRFAVGFLLLGLSTILALVIFAEGRVELIFLVATVAWVPSVFLTDKYVHKYPQRYVTYLIASHLKAAILMAVFLWIIGSIASPNAVPPDILWTTYFIFIFADAIASALCYQDMSYNESKLFDSISGKENVSEDASNGSSSAETNLPAIDTQAILKQIPSDLDKPLIEFIESNLPDLHGEAGKVLVSDDVSATGIQVLTAPVGLLVGRTRLNDVLRLNNYLQFCVKRISMGGYFVFRYMPLENVAKEMKKRYTGIRYWLAMISYFIWYRAIPKIPWLDLLYFWRKISWLDSLVLSITKRRNRALSKAEVWGRLSYYGMHVIAESKGDGEVYLIAQRIALPVEGKRPSYYPVVALEKVGLNGEIIRMHKIRTMYPFSEFLQKRIFEDHGLASTGKFSNDYRLTDVGKFLRKYWLDELPQIFDWMRGDVKLVGMRATSQQFLSLYPQNFIDLYLQVKPGLIPPIFDESTNGFDQIVKVELTYLQRYCDRPIRTDIHYLIQTFTDIFIKGIRSK